MKQAMFLVFGVVSLMSSNAYASRVICDSSGQIGGESVSLEVEGNERYTIFIYGTSRNTYKAQYKALREAKMGWPNTLIKVADKSTWNDMPIQVRLTFTGYTYRLEGVSSGKINFDLIADCALAE